MSDKQVNYDITADGSNFVQTFERCASVLSSSSTQMQSHIGAVGNTFKALMTPLMAVTGILAGGAAFKAAIDESSKLTGEANKLSRALALTVDEAATLNTALGDVYSDSDTYISAFQKFAKQIKTNEDGLKAMGLQTRDSNGDLRDSNELFREALAVVGEYKPGLDQTTAAMTLFGKGVDDVLQLQKLNNDVIDAAREKNIELGLAVSQEGVEANKKYKAAMNDVGDVLTGVMKVVGDGVKPIFTDLAEYFARLGPTAIMIFRTALDGLVGAFRIVQASVKTLAAVVFETINTMMDYLGGLSELLAAVFRGDFKAAADIWEQNGQRVIQGISNVVDATKEAWREAGETFKQDQALIWGGTKANTVAGVSGKRTMKEGDGKKEKDKAPSSDMPVYEQQLAQARTAAAEMDAIRGMSKEAELKFWQDILASSTLKQQDKIAVTKKVEEARLRVLQESAQVAQQLDQISLDTWQQRELAKVEMEAERARQRAAAEEITQETLLEQEAQFEARRQQIRLAYLQSQRASLDPLRDPVQIAQINAQIEGLEQQHQLRMAQIKGQQAQAAAAEQKRIWGDATQRIESLWDKGVESMMNGTFRWRNAQKAVGAELAAWGAGVIKRQVAQWILGEQGKTAATASGTAQRLVMEGWAAAKSVALWAATAVKNIMTSAWEAMASAWKAIVGIPYVGPVLAPIAAGAAFAGVAALAGRVSSAEGGYDIPANVNPLTQLHEKEMVLPAKHADVIRQLADSNFAQANSNQAPVVFHGMGAGDFFIAHKKDLARVMQSMNRNFAFK
ncbi:hypothetical protein [Ideonella paludis]|uniref:Uncharacterized protein n=1 Tax=Ideonella paludis TaxID=1233411 RepID=A0ABS5DU31_9BURK|nr:hypothetical protein [Ideonella paludis]MBQ0934653.1 hypothetical protein [Ideonella paludis]